MPQNPYCNQRPIGSVYGKVDFQIALSAALDERPRVPEPCTTEESTSTGWRKFQRAGHRAMRRAMTRVALAS